MSVTLERERRYGLPVMPQRDLVLVEGRGATVIDENGRTYVDCVSGHGVAILGHCNPAIIDAIHRQAHRLITCTAIL